MRRSTKVLAVTTLLVALVLAGLVSPFASSDPDGLTKVSEKHGFAHTAKSHDSVFGGYGSLTGVVGVLVVLALAGGLAYAVRRRDHDDDRDQEQV